MKITTTRRAALLAGLGTTLARPAFAQAWPTRPVSLIVP